MNFLCAHSKACEACAQHTSRAYYARPGCSRCLVVRSLLYHILLYRTRAHIILLCCVVLCVRVVQHALEQPAASGWKHWHTAAAAATTRARAC